MYAQYNETIHLFGKDMYMFPKPLISAHIPNESEFGLCCNTLSIYQENIF